MSVLRSRVIIAGEPTVGKTCIVNQLINSTFNHNYMMTQGCDYHVKDIQLEDDDYYSRVELHLIDMAGQNIFKEITFELMGKANMIVLVYDVSNPDTFHLLRTWFDQIKQQNNGRDLAGVVVANKVDLENRAQIGTADGQAFAQSIGFEFFECSSLQSKGIDAPFKCLANMVKQRYEERVAMLRAGK